MEAIEKIFLEMDYQAIRLIGCDTYGMRYSRISPYIIGHSTSGE